MPHKNLIQENISLHDKNWFATGGAARYFAQPYTEQEFAQALFFAHAQHLPIFVLGHGANILISDEGVDGLVIQPQLTTIMHQMHPQETDYALIKAGAGTSMHDLILYCLDRNLLGLEEFSGIPGTVGGSVYINLHYFEFLLEQFLDHATVIHKSTGKQEIVTPEWFGFGYNKSRLQDEEYYLLDAIFKAKIATPLETAYARGRHVEIIRHRKNRYPNKNTCGSFFRNFLPEEVTFISNGKKMVYVAYYLDKIGVKGQLRINDALVSHQHANMLVNQGKATSADLIRLARTMQEMVHKQFNIIPQPECRLIGFKEYPLL
jgi:UDP-N-acetylmuramate dehydrogenase